MARRQPGAAPRFTVPEVWRHIVKKNERHAGKLFDVLVCNHSVPANDNRYRRARSCPECRITVQEFADQRRADSGDTRPNRARRGGTPRQKSSVR